MHVNVHVHVHVYGFSLLSPMGFQPQHSPRCCHTPNQAVLLAPLAPQPLTHELLQEARAQRHEAQQRRCMHMSEHTGHMSALHNHTLARSPIPRGSTRPADMQEQNACVGACRGLACLSMFLAPSCSDAHKQRGSGSAPAWVAALSFLPPGNRPSPLPPFFLLPLPAPFPPFLPRFAGGVAGTCRARVGQRVSSHARLKSCTWLHLFG